MSNAVNHYVASYATLKPQLPGQSLAWLAPMRDSAFAEFAAHGFPTPNQEEWRYTNVSALAKTTFNSTAQPVVDATLRACLAHWQLPDAWCIVLVDGHFVAECSILADLPPDVVLTSMAEALHSYPDLVAQHLAQAVQSDEHRFVAFNTAWFTDGVFLHVPSKHVLAKPIQILQIITQEQSLANTRSLVIVENLAELTLIESFAATSPAIDKSLTYLNTAVTEVFIGEQAHVTGYYLQAESEQAYHFSGSYVQQAPNAHYTQHSFSFGGLLARHDIHTDLDRAAECHINGLFSGIKRQHSDHHTRINHTQPHAVSKELYKGILNDRARGVFQGRVVVAEHAQKTDSQMNNRNLLLSDNAEIDSKPQLEIYADDVKCAHGMTIGQLDEKSVFYLQSRGVDSDTARNMLTFAFANEMVDKITVKSLHDQVLEQLLTRFPQEGVEKEWL